MSVPGNKNGYRWDYYCLRQADECSAFWENYLSTSDHQVLFVVGLGFDPRMCLGLHMLMKVGSHSVKECLLIEYDEGERSPSRQHNELIKVNLDSLMVLMGKAGVIQRMQVPMWSPDRKRRIGSRRISDAIQAATINRFTDVVLDISSMPRTIFFPLIAKILYLLDASEGIGPCVNLHVIVPEQASLDSSIQEEGIDNDASYMHGFTSDLVQESTADVPRVWVPILGEGKQTQLIRLYDHVRPDEICPVLPSPSVNPRRADDLVVEYHELLFDRLRVEPANFIYASERNPFEAYRQIYQTIERYNSALEALGKCKVVMSALSSKLLSVGALLAAYEAKRSGFMVGISHVETQGYTIVEASVPLNPQLFTLWIAGDYYNA
jgi:hypothetical protein